MKEEESREPVLRFVQNEVADDLGKGGVVGVRGTETRGQAVEKGVLRKGGVRAVHSVGVFKSFNHLRSCQGQKPVPATDRSDRVFPSPHRCSQKTRGHGILARGAEGQDGAGRLGSRGGGGSGQRPGRESIPGARPSLA